MDVSKDQDKRPTRSTSALRPAASIGRTGRLIWMLVEGFAIVALIFAICFLIVYPMKARAAEVEALVIETHDSNLVQGWPRNNRAESSHDFLGAGVTITAGTRSAWHIDIAHGIKSVDRQRRETGTHFAVRFYPGRLRN